MAEVDHVLLSVSDDNETIGVPDRDLTAMLPDQRRGRGPETCRMSQLERSHLIELHEGSLAMVQANDIDAYDAFYREVHGCIYRATHNSFLAEHAQDVRSLLSAFRRPQ
jgi:hypothetical protein